MEMEYNNLQPEVAGLPVNVQQAQGQGNKRVQSPSKNHGPASLATAPTKEAPNSIDSSKVPSSSNLMETGGQRSWSELKKQVLYTKKLTGCHSLRIPFSFSFRKVGARTRLYMLGCVEGTRQNTLLRADLPLCATPEQFVLSPIPLIHDIAFRETFSREEEMQRERKRVAANGITSYDHCNGQFLFLASSKLYYCTDEAGEEDDSKASVVQCPEASCASVQMDAKFCPADLKIISYVRSNDLFVLHLCSGQETRLTFSNNGKSAMENPHSSGVPPYVLQEEFGLYSGYWWQPTGHHIVYLQVDESDVEVVNVLTSRADGSQTVDDYCYPKAGSPNAYCMLRMLLVEDCGDVKYLKLREELDIAYPWVEYIVRVDWIPSGEGMIAQVLNRRQTRLAFVYVPLAAYYETDAKLVILYEEENKCWVNMCDTLHILDSSSGDYLQFIYSSAISGYRHLYFVCFKLSTSQVVSNQQLTSGSWEISNKPVWVDKNKQLLYFVGFKDTPLESHLYVTSLSVSNSPVERVTQLGFSHSVWIDTDCENYVSIYSSVEQPPCASVYCLQKCTSSFLAEIISPITMKQFLPPPLLVAVPLSCGVVLQAMIYRPIVVDSQTRVKFPTVLYVYGGPQCQLVTNSYKSHRFPRLQMLVLLGYAVVVIDNRGSPNRGTQFESHIHRALGQVEIDDQVEALRYIANNVVDFIDMSRVAIHGWSYGGFLSLMGIIKHPEVFKCAISGAPVTSWFLYDTGYTERYLGLPQDNAQLYRECSVLSRAELIPNDSVLIVHGLMDENVFFSHTKQLVSRLIELCISHQLQVYPNERHGLRNSDTSLHFETLMLDFLQKRL